MEIKLARQAIDRDWVEDQYISLYYAARARNELPTARGCLRDLAEHHGMFVKRVAVIRGSELEQRLAKGRERAGLVIDGEASAASASAAAPGDVKRLALQDPDADAELQREYFEVEAALAGARSRPDASPDDSEAPDIMPDRTPAAANKQTVAKPHLPNPPATE